MAKATGLAELKKQISENKISGLYLLFGEENYLRKSYVKKITERIDDCGLPDFNKIVIDGKSANLSETEDAIESFPMISETKPIKYW